MIECRVSLGKGANVQGQGVRWDVGGDEACCAACDGGYVLRQRRDVRLWVITVVRICFGFSIK